jgi:uncharacterized linocin/CFP29 family protein
MANKYLARDDAPFGSEIWSALDSTMKDAATSQLVGRRLLPLEGPFGLGLKTIPLADGVDEESGLLVSDTLPVPMIQQPFTLGLRDLASHESEGTFLDTRPVAEAAIAVAKKEDALIFNGAAGLPGLMTVNGANACDLSDWDEVGTAADDLIAAVTQLDAAGFHGPYIMALAPERFNKLYRLYPRGKQTEMEHLASIVTDGIYKAPILEDGGVLLATGRQFAAIVMGQDMTIGFIGPAGDEIEFTISESLAVRIRRPEAICKLHG